MILSAMITEIGIELQDVAKAIWTDAIITRAVTKSVVLMSRLIPKRSVVEATLTREVTGETLTIASNTGTLANKLVKVGSLVITDETLDTDYTVNYLTGVVTEIGALLVDGDYTAKYDVDPNMFDLSTVLTTDFIKIERVEYPAGAVPRTNITFDHVGNFLVFGIALAEDAHIRITYLEPWTAPGVSAGNYPVHLDEAIIIGSVGQCLIYLAETYMQAAITNVLASKTALDAISAVTMASSPSTTTELADANTALDAAIVRFAAAVTEADKGDTPLANATTATGKMAARTAAGLTLIETGDDLIPTINDAEKVAEKYAQYAGVEALLSQAYGEEADKEVVIANAWEARAAREMAIGNSYVQEAVQRLATVSRLVEKYQQELIGDTNEVNYYRAQIDKAVGYQTSSRQYTEAAGRYLASGQAKINEMLIMLGVKPEFRVTKAHSEQRD